MGIRDSIGRRLLALSDYLQPPAPRPASERPDVGKYRSGSRDDYHTNRTARDNLSPEKIGIILRRADEGNTAAQYELWEKVEQDPRVGRLYLRRRQAVLFNPLRIEAEDTDDPRAVQASDLANAALFGGEYKSGRISGISHFGDAMFHLSDAIGKGFAAQFVEWAPDGGLILPVLMERWPQQEFQLGDPSAYMAQDHDDIRVLTDDAWSGKRLAEFAPGQWLTHIHKTFSQPIARAGMFRSVTWYWMFKTFGMGDWSILLERYGIPPRKGTYGKDSDAKEQQELWTALLSMGKDHACMVPDGSTIELIEQKGQGAGGAPHPDMVRHCNEEIAVAIAGNTMAVDQGDRGARSAKEAYQREDFIQAQFDANGGGAGQSGGLAGSIREGLVEPLIAYNLGADYPVPRVYFDLDDAEDLGKRIKLDREAQAMGYPLTVGYMRSKYYGDTELPEGVDPGDLLETAQSATSAALDQRIELLALAESKKKSMNWVLSRLRSREE